MNLPANRYFKILALVCLMNSKAAVAQGQFVSSNIPIVIIDTQGRKIHDDYRVTANMKVLDNGAQRNFVSDVANGYEGKISIETRGSTSQSFPKKQYGIETQTSDGDNNNVSLLGLPEENDWILSSPYSDKSLIRNILAYKLSESLGHYAPRTRLCELLLNDEYVGVYVLTEKIKRDANRVNIAKLNPDEEQGDDVTGGYIIKIDKTTGDNCAGWHTETKSQYLQYEYPDCDEIIPAQKSYIQGYFNDFERKLFSNDFTDSTQGYWSLIDLNSTLDYLIINELSKNVDGYFFSTFMHKDKQSKGGKLNFGPVWDYNIAFGNANYRNGYTTDGLLAFKHPWWNRFLQDSVFCNRLKERWDNVRKNELSNTRILNLIDSLALVLNEAQARNFEKWCILGKPLWPNYYVGTSYTDEIRFLKSWIINRLNWLDNNIPGEFESYAPFNEYEANVFPNPFDYFLTISFLLEDDGYVSIDLLDMQGNSVASVLNEMPYKAGKHKITCSSFVNGNRLSNGVYLLVLKVDDTVVFTERIIKKY